MKPNFQKYILLFLISLLCISVTGNFIYNASSHILGKDESLYIFLSKGHFSHTPIDAPSGSFIDAIKNGMVRTADPPGFFILLHLWEFISFSEAWLRLLPYLFFIISIISLVRIGMLCKLPPILCASLGFLPLGAHFMVVHAIEVRGYGLEFCLTYITIWCALKITLSLNDNQPLHRIEWITLTLMMIFGLSSRFSFAINAAGIYSVLWLCVFQSFKSHHFKQYIIHTAISSFISLLVFIFFISVRVYLTSIDAINAVPPDFDMYAIPGIFTDKLFFLFKQIWLIPVVLCAGSGALDGNYYVVLIPLLISVGVFLCYHIFYNLIKGDGIQRIKKQPFQYLLFFIYPALVIVMGMILALLNLHPFTTVSRWSLFLHPAYHIFIIGLIKLAIDKHIDKSQTTNRFQIIQKITFPSLIVLTAMMYGILFMSYKISFRMGGGQHTSRVIYSMLSEEELKDIDAWYISVGEANSFKYHVLYGNLKNKLSPQASIVIENRPASIKNITCQELPSIYDKTPEGSYIAMVTGHVNRYDAVKYARHFRSVFKSAICGPHQKSYEQICVARR